MEFQEILYTIAQVAATLAGFASVVAVLERADSQRELAVQHLLKRMLATSFSVMFFSIVLATVLASTEHSNLVWRWSNVAFGLFHLVGISTDQLPKFQGTVVKRGQLYLIYPVASMLILLNFAVGAGYLQDYAPLTFICGLCWLMGVACWFFAILVMSTRRST